MWSALYRSTQLTGHKRGLESDDDACDNEDEYIDVPDLGNPEESTAEQVRLLKASLESGMMPRLYRFNEGKPSTKVLDTLKVVQFIESVFSKPSLDVNKSSALREWGIRTLTLPNVKFPVDIETMRRFETSVLFDPSREYNQFAPLTEIWSELKRKGVITEELIVSIKQHFKSYCSTQRRKVSVYSNLILSRKEGEKSFVQKLHCDHSFGAGNELVLAIDLSGNQLKTRYYAGSINVKGFNKHLGQTGAQNARLMNVETGRGQCRTSLGRAYNLLLEACVQDKPIRYVEADAPCVIFDAGGLHSGNAVASPGPRVFFTIRTDHFHAAYGQYVRDRGDQDVWFPQKPIETLFELEADAHADCNRVIDKHSTEN